MIFLGQISTKATFFRVISFLSPLSSLSIILTLPILETAEVPPIPSMPSPGTSFNDPGVNSIESLQM